MAADEMIVWSRVAVETIRSDSRGKLLDLADFALRLVQRVLIALLVAEFDERFHIVDALGGGVQTLQLRFRGGQPAGDLLAFSGSSHRPGAAACVSRSLISALSRSTSSALAMDSYLARFADRLGKVKFCHRGLPYC